MEKGDKEMTQKKAVLYANSFEQVSECMEYAEKKSYQVIAMKNKDHDIISELEMEVLLIATSIAHKRTWEELDFIEKMRTWHEVELVVCK